MNYKDAGVNVELASDLVDKIKPYSNQIGNFAATCPFPYSAGSDLVMSCDGVGTKVLLARYAKDVLYRPMNSIGQDCVAMVVNDILCENAEPLYFMDYFATGELEESNYLEVITGINDACKSIGVKLVGGETAELPGMFKTRQNFDVCGFGVGCKIDDTKKRMQKGDVLIGLYSSGLHSNGFSLINKLMDDDHSIDRTPELIENLLAPTKIYKDDLNEFRKKMVDIKVAANITGGGWSNLDRVVDQKSSINWKTKEKSFYAHEELFEWIQTKAELSNEEMFNIFNCGIGMMLVVNPKNLKSVNVNYEFLGTIE